MKQSSKLFKFIGLLLVVELLFAALPTGQVQAQTLVTTEAELRSAVLLGGSISLQNDINLSAHLEVGQPNTVIQGNSHTLTFTGLEVATPYNDGLIITNNGVTVSNLKVNAGLSAPTIWVGTYAINVSGSTGVTLNNVGATGGNGGIRVGSSSVTFTGTIDVSGNGSGGIESTIGLLFPTTNPALNVASATFTNTTEAYGLPTIWEDGVSSTVTTLAGQFNKMVKGTQPQYYLNELKFNGTENGIITDNGFGAISGSVTGTYPLTISGSFTSLVVGNRATFQGTVSGGFSGNVTGAININGVDTLTGTITGTGATKTVRIIGIFPQSGIDGEFVGQIITDETPFVPATSIAITTPSNVSTVFERKTLQLGVTIDPPTAEFGAWSIWEPEGTNTGSTIDETGLLTAGTPGTIMVIAKALDGSLLDATKTITILVDDVAPMVTTLKAFGATGFGDVLAINLTFTVVEGYTVKTIDITMSEPVTVVAGTAVTLAGAPYGTVSVSTDGLKLIVTPNAGNKVASAVGSFVFSIPAGSVKDLAGNPLTTLEATLVVTNLVPVAVDDAYTVVEDGVLTVSARGVLTNDTDFDPSVLTAIIVAQPSSGTVTLNSDGSFTYRPAFNFNGTASFTYKANDGKYDSNVATVTITVTAIKDSPEAVGDFYATNQDKTLVVSAADGVMKNDTDIDLNTMTTTLLRSVTHGTLTLLGDGSFTYTPAPGFFGTDTFRYQLVTYPALKKAVGWTDEALVTITVTPSPYIYYFPLIFK